MPKKIYIKTYGCQMNVYDSQRIADLMAISGYEYSDNPENCDMIVINTCHIREKASEKLFSDLGRIRPLKEQMIKNGKQMIVTVAGCVAQAEGEEIFKRAPVVDIIVGPESYQTLPDLVAKSIREKSREINLDFNANQKFDSLTYRKSSTNYSSFLTIQEGCDKFCTFCVVPYTRGAEYSRSVDSIINDAKNLADNGACEIYLLGQNVNAFIGSDSKSVKYNLADLIFAISKIDGIKRIRYTTSHPNDMSQSLIEAHRDCDKLMPFLHLPIQSGSNHILKAMNRKHQREKYFEIIANLRSARSDIALSSDFIVGFPGESDRDFFDTIDLVEKIGFAQCYSFKYSPRPGTPAADISNQITEEVKDERLAILQKLLTKQQIDFNQSYESKVFDVMFEKLAPKSKASDKLQLWGKSPYLQSVIVEISDNQDIDKYLGKIMAVEVVKSRPSSLIGKLVNL
jgi:tRNA-2-methylthio-N6-dimethylallyladenosine synthase